MTTQEVSAPAVLPKAPEKRHVRPFWRRRDRVETPGRVYLVDYENVQSEGLRGVENLTQDDRVLIFYSVNGRHLTFETHMQILQSKARFTYLEASVGGKNALDNQLASYLGYLIGQKIAKRYYIVSRDRGYRHIMNFWEAGDATLSIEMIDGIERMGKEPTAIEIKPPVQFKERIDETKLLVVLPSAKGKAWLRDAVRYVNTSKDKAELYTNIVRRVGQDEGRDVYMVLKKYL